MNLRVSFGLLCLGLAVLAPTQGPTPPKDAPEATIRRHFRPTPARQGGWQPSKKTAAALAQSVDAAVAKLSDCSFQTMAFCFLPEGRATALRKSQIASPTRYRIEHVMFGTGTQPVTRGAQVADGKFVSVQTPTKVAKGVPVASLKPLAGLDLVAVWPRQFGNLLFAGLGNSARPLGSYVQAARASKSGLTMTVEQRTVKADGKPVVQERILFARSPAATKRLGYYAMEMVFDGARKLPVSVRMSDEPKGRKPTRISWGVRFNMAKGQKFDADLFSVPR